MKLAGLLMMTVLTQFRFSGESQTLNFSGKDIALKDIFRVIKCQTGVLFFYDAALLKDAKPVTVQWKNVSLEAALKDIFKDQPVTWILQDKTVTIIKRPLAFIKNRHQSRPLDDIAYNIRKILSRKALPMEKGIT